MQESMRLFPVVGSGTTRRNLEKDMWLGGGKLFVPKGVLLWVPMHAVQNVSANWDEPDKFQPERWSQVSPPHPPTDALPFVPCLLCPLMLSLSRCCDICFFPCLPMHALRSSAF